MYQLYIQQSLIIVWTHSGHYAIATSEVSFTLSMLSVFYACWVCYSRDILTSQQKPQTRKHTSNGTESGYVLEYIQKCLFGINLKKCKMVLWMNTCCIKVTSVRKRLIHPFFTSGFLKAIHRLWISFFGLQCLSGYAARALCRQLFFPHFIVKGMKYLPSWDVVGFGARTESKMYLFKSN